MVRKTVMVVMTERMYEQLAKYAASLSARPRRSGRLKEYSLEDALLLGGHAVHE